MKIGQVVKEYNIPVNRLYFYINNGLLVPPRKNNQYVFDEKTLEELRWILELKDMDFSLKHIHRLLSLRRISGFNSPEDRQEMANIYRLQLEELRQQEMHLVRARQRVEEAYRNILPEPETDPRRSGVPLRLLPLLCCPTCISELEMSDVEMNQKYIFKAKLKCNCGYCASIENGVVITPHRNTSPFDKPDTTRELYRDLPSMTLSMFERSYRWMEEKIRQDIPHGKVWMETHVNAWFFFHNHMDLLSNQDTLIVVDKFPETLYAYKVIIDRQQPRCSVLYIADSSTSLPLLPESVDCHMDFFAVNEYNFYHQGLLTERLLPFLKKDATLVGTYFYFNRGRRSIQKAMEMYPESSSSNFNLHWFLMNMERAFRFRDMEDCGSSQNSGDNLGLGFHVPGEELTLRSYIATRKKR